VRAVAYCTSPLFEGEQSIPGDCKNDVMAPRRRPGRTSRRRRPGVLGTLINDATGVIQSVANEMVPPVVDAIDVNEVVGRLDIEAVVDRVDIQGVVNRVDLQEVIESVDLNKVLEGIDVDALIGKIDLNAVLGRADLNALLARVDVNALVARIDMEQVIENLDINAIVARIDVESLIERTDIGSIIAATGAGVASKAIDVARSQGVGLDFFVQRWTDRLLRRRASRSPGGPALLMHEQEPALP
jgi:hypothetical protein